MLNTITLLIAYQLVGEVISYALALPVPGPVIGMALLFLTLLAFGKVSHEIRSGSANLLQHLSLLFVPAGAGVMVHLHRVANEWLPILAGLVLSTLAGLAVTALVLKAMLARREKTGADA